VTNIEIGIFSRTFTRTTLEQVLDAVGAHGLSHVHFNLNSAGVANLPEEIGDHLCARIRRTFETRGFVMTSISGTFNAIHPDARQRELDTRRACRIIESCRSMGTSTVSLCTGSRDPLDMWRRHPDNQLPDAWQDLLATLGRLLPVAESSGVILGIEPETNNVVDSAVKARRLLDELRSPNLKIIMDGANLFEGLEVDRMQDVLTEAFDLLAADIVMVHAKDITGDPTHTHQAAGTGKLDWNTYCRLLKQNNYAGVVILHNLREAEVKTSIAFLEDHLADWYPGMRAEKRPMSVLEQDH
jgi:sugar phosphate isomerase/epimerase